MAQVWVVVAPSARGWEEKCTEKNEKYRGKCTTRSFPTEANGNECITRFSKETVRNALGAAESLRDNEKFQRREKSHDKKKKEAAFARSRERTRQDVPHPANTIRFPRGRRTLKSLMDPPLEELSGGKKIGFG